MPEHTPGPLRVEKVRHSDAATAFEIRDNCGNLIAQLWWDAGENYPDLETTEANALVFAAAPELLNALEPALELLREAKPGHDEVFMPEEYNWWCIVIDNAEAAIKKAKEPT